MRPGGMPSYEPFIICHLYSLEILWNARSVLWVAPTGKECGKTAEELNKKSMRRITRLGGNIFGTTNRGNSLRYPKDYMAA